MLSRRSAWSRVQSTSILSDRATARFAEDDERRIVEVVKIGHRRDLYRCHSPPNNGLQLTSPRSELSSTGSVRHDVV